MAWPVKKLGDVCDLVGGGTPSKSIEQYYEGNIPWATVRDMKNEVLSSTEHRITKEAVSKSSTKIIQKGNIITATRVGLGKVCILSQDTAINQDLKAVIPKDKTITKPFLFYWLKSIAHIIEAAGTGATVKGVKLPFVKGLMIPVPSEDEQKRIVAILDQAFAEIDKARANAEQNLKNARELFESYLQQVFSQRGEGWVENELGEIASVGYGYTDKSSAEGDYRYIRITDIDKDGRLIQDGKKYIKHSKEAEKFYLSDNDLLMARTGATFAKVLLYKDFEKSIFASYLIRIKFTEKIRNELYWYFTKTKGYWRQANKLSSGAAQPHFNGAALKQVIFPYPTSVNEQELLIAKFKTILDETSKVGNIYTKKLEALDELKKSILQKAFTGELTQSNHDAAA